MRHFIILTFLTLLIPINHPHVALMIERLSSQESDDGAVVCPPNVYFIAPDDCSPLGPTETITSGLEEGISYPISPLPAVPLLQG